jgi:hypothetical protein
MAEHSKQMKKFLALLPLVLALTGCSIVPHIPILKSIYSGPTTRETQAVTKAQAKTDKERAELEGSQAKFEARIEALESNKVQTGSAFVYGTGKALDHATTNDPAVVLAKDLNDVAQQALPKPATKDTIVMDRAVADSLGTNQVRGAQEIKALEERLAKTESQLAATQANYLKDVADLQSDLDKAIAKERATSSKVAVKANKFDEANSLWGSTKLFFSNGVHVVLSLLVVGIIGWVVWKVGKIAASIYCPPVALGMNSVEGLTSHELAAGFAQVVNGGKKFLAAVEKSDILPETKAKISELFTSIHKEAQDLHIQEAVKKLIQPHV